MQIVRTTLLIFVIATLTACAGQQFVRPSGDLIQLGKTTEFQVIAAMGDSESPQWGELRGNKIKIMVYAYVMVPGGGRAANFYFLDGVLVGHFFTSDFADETTDFDITKVGNIVENESTHKDVEAILGKPAGEAIYPFLENPEGRVLWYRFHGATVYKKADFEIDKDGIVRQFSVKVTPGRKGK